MIHFVVKSSGKHRPNTHLNKLWKFHLNFHRKLWEILEWSSLEVEKNDHLTTPHVHIFYKIAQHLYSTWKKNQSRSSPTIKTELGWFFPF